MFFCVYFSDLLIFSKKKKKKQELDKEKEKNTEIGNEMILISGLEVNPDKIESGQNSQLNLLELQLWCQVRNKEKSFNTYKQTLTCVPTIANTKQQTCRNFSDK